MCSQLLSRANRRAPGAARLIAAAAAAPTHPICFFSEHLYLAAREALLAYGRRSRRRGAAARLQQPIRPHCA
jgi:hypothetical protein